MAKQRDDHNQPRKKKEDSDIVPMEDVEILEEIEEVDDVVEEPPAKPAPPVNPILGKPKADPKKTKVAKRQAAPTMLAPQDELEELEEVEPPKKTPPLAKPVAATPPKPEEPQDPKKTKIAPRNAAPTMLAPQDELEELEEVEPPKSPPADPKKTRVATKSAQPTMLAPDMPNLSLDEPKAKKGSAADELVDVESAAEEEVLDVLEAAPGSDVIASEFAKGAPGSDVIDLVEAESISGAKKPSSASDVVEISSDVLAVEPVSAVSSGSSDVIDIEETEPASDVLELSSGAVEAKSGELASDVVEIKSDVLELEEAKSGSSVVEAVEAVEDVSDDDYPASAVDIGREKPRASPRELASDIFSAEDELEAPVSDVFSADKGEDVLDESEALKGGSSVVNWDDVEAGSDVKETDKTKGGIELESTLAFDSAVTKKTGDDLLTAEDVGDLDKPKSGALSGVDPVAEALESGVNLDSSSGKKKRKADADAEDIDLAMLDAAEAESELEASAVDLGGPPPKKSKVKKQAEEVDEANLFDDSTEMDVTAAEEAEEAVEAEDLLETDDEEGPPKKKKKSAEEEAEDLLLSEDEAAPADEDEVTEQLLFDDEETVQLPKKSKMQLRDEDEELEDLEAAAPKGKKKKKKSYDDDDDGGVATLTRKLPKPKYGRRWLGGTFLGLLLAAGGAGAVWYFAPELLDEIPQSPNAKEKPKVEPGGLTKVEADKLNAEVVKTKADWDEDIKKAGEREKKLKDAAALVSGDVKKLADELADKKTELGKVLSTIAEVHKTLMTEKLVDGDAFDAKKFQAAVLGLGDASRDYKQLNMLLMEKTEIKETGSKGLMALLDQKKTVDDELVAINKLIEGDKLKGSKGIEELLKRRDGLVKERDLLDDVVVTAFKVLAGKGDPRKKLVEAAHDARVKGESPLAIPLTSLATGVAGLPLGFDKVFAKGVDTAALATEVAFFRLREPLITGPDKNIDLYLVLLQDRARGTDKDIDNPVREATWLLSDKAKSGPELKAKAHYVLGLASRNQEKYTDAVKSFAAALDELKGVKDAGLWSELAKLSHAELTDPAAFFLPRAELLVRDSEFKKAIDLLDTGLKVMPENAHLLVERALVRAEQARDTGKIPAADIVAIRDDAGAALKEPETQALASYVLGLVDQAQKNHGKAESRFREALKLARAGKSKRGMSEHELILIALTRSLESDGSDDGVVDPPMKKKVDDKKVDEKKVDDKKVDDKKADEKKEDDKKADDKKVDEKKGDDKKVDEKKVDEKKGAMEETRLLESHQELLVLLTVGVFPGEDEEDDAARRERIKERIAIAEKLIASDNPKVKGQGYMLKGKALYDAGDRNEGLRTYLQGIGLTTPGKASTELVDLFKEHPAFGYPDAAPRPNRYVAEDHFARGLHNYWLAHRSTPEEAQKLYVQAEKSLRQSIHWFTDDARYHYYYGLALWAQKKATKEGREKEAAAIYAFKKGSALEAKNLPSPDTVSLGLERVQGELRQMLNGHRPSALTAFIGEEEKKK